MENEAKKIIDALRYCSEFGECRACIYRKECVDKLCDIDKDAADLIEQQNAEIERLRDLVVDKVPDEIRKKGNGYEHN